MYISHTSAIIASWLPIWIREADKQLGEMLFGTTGYRKRVEAPAESQGGKGRLPDQISVEDVRVAVFTVFYYILLRCSTLFLIQRDYTAKE